MEEPRRLVRLLDERPELGDELSAFERRRARDFAVAETVALERGSLLEAAELALRPGDLGLFVLDGLLVASVAIAGDRNPELLGPGDLTLPHVALSPDASVTADEDFTVIQPVRLAVLDRAFARRIAEWPEITAALMRRLAVRARWLGFQLAVRPKPLEDRLLLVLWHLADRWGRVTPEGVALRIELTHSLLADVVGASRPSTTSALGRLREAGLISYGRTKPGIVLRAPAPAELGRLHDQATPSRVDPGDYAA